MNLIDNARQSRAIGPLEKRSASAPVGRNDRLDWRQRYSRYTAVTDLLVMVWAAAGAHMVQSSSLFAGVRLSPVNPGFIATSAGIVVLWLVILQLFESRDAKITGLGAEEYKRVLNATFVVFAIVAMVSYLFKLELPRSYLLIVMPAGMVGLIAGRWLWRRWLQHQRDLGEFVTKVLALGDEQTVKALITELRRAPRAGYRIVGACLPGGSAGTREILGVPVVGALDDAVEAVQATKADAVAVTATTEFGPEAVRRLSWDLEKTRAELILAPALTDIAGPRVHTQPVAGLPLIHVERATYSGPTRLIKPAFDVIGATMLLVLLSPLMLAIAIAIKASSPGPVFFRQERVGVGASRFRMVKFRSMRVDAEAMLEHLRAQQAADAGNHVMFKLKDDPRITRIGAFLRRYSLDEVPQLINVLRGEMSLVGPRPPLPSEVEMYETDTHRRLLVRPGMTGLWQVSGRSDLSWDETVRLDLSYVENWSLTGDMVILFKTAKAVVGSDGAY